MAEPEFAQLTWRAQTLRLEYQWVGDADSRLAPLVFLHEGLGSLAMWKDFPARLCAGNGLRGMVFSRYGYGRSTPKPSHEQWSPDFMHVQAFEVLPMLFDALHIETPWLFGHSDGGSIALLYASRFAVSGVIAVAPHIFVEDCSIASIEVAREAYAATDLRARLARYHFDPDSAFLGWNDVWLNPDFRDWNIETELDTIRAPCWRCKDSTTNTEPWRKYTASSAALPKTRLLMMEKCAHSPHRDQPDFLIREAARFIFDQTHP